LCEFLANRERDPQILHLNVFPKQDVCDLGGHRTLSGAVIVTVGGCLALVTPGVTDSFPTRTAVVGTREALVLGDVKPSQLVPSEFSSLSNPRVPWIYSTRKRKMARGLSWNSYCTLHICPPPIILFRGIRFHSLSCGCSGLCSFPAMQI
jgi:hypothetical protein